MDVTTGKRANEVVDDEDDDVGFSGCALRTPYFASVVFDVSLLSEVEWVLRCILTPVLISQSALLCCVLLLTISNKRNNSNNDSKTTS